MSYILLPLSNARVVRIEDAALLVDVAPTAVREWIAEGLLPFARRGDDIRVSAVETVNAANEYRLSQQRERTSSSLQKRYVGRERQGM